MPLRPVARCKWKNRRNQWERASAPIAQERVHRRSKKRRGDMQRLAAPDARERIYRRRRGGLVLNCRRAVSVCTVFAGLRLTSRWYWSERLRFSNHRQTFAGSWWYYRLPFAWYLGKRPTTRREPVRGLA